MSCWAVVEKVLKYLSKSKDTLIENDSCKSKDTLIENDSGKSESHQ